MAKYIEREAVINVVANNPYNVAFKTSKTIQEIEKIPSADVVEVVRCKECKHAYINSFSAQSGVALCKFWSNRAEGNNLVVQQDDYCSYGERKCE